MINQYLIDWPLIETIVSGVLGIAVLVLAWRWYRRRLAAAALTAAMTGGAFEFQRNVLLPDPQGLSLHVDYLLLTARGVVVIDYRAVRGNVFGGDQMTDWTVMDGALRYTFNNPQAGLYDRMAAVRVLAPEIPVEGRIVFGKRAKFPKGLPSHSCKLASLAADFPAADRQTVGALPDVWMKEWALLLAACQPSTLSEVRAAI
jgi:Nuclease-related domain